MDRWTVSFDPPFIDDHGKTTSEIGMLNYFSIGVDARVALQFHQTRNSSPQLFNSRLVNKGWYGLFGAQVRAEAMDVECHSSFVAVVCGVHN